MKTEKFTVRKSCWINGQLRAVSDTVYLTKLQKQELAPPYGSSVVPFTPEESKEPSDAKLNGNKRTVGAKSK